MGVGPPPSQGPLDGKGHRPDLPEVHFLHLLEGNPEEKGAPHHRNRSLNQGHQGHHGRHHQRRSDPDPVAVEVAVRALAPETVYRFRKSWAPTSAPWPIITSSPGVREKITTG